MVPWVLPTGSERHCGQSTPRSFALERWERRGLDHLRERRLSLGCVSHTNGRVFQIIVGLCCTRERVWAWRQTKWYIRIFDVGKSELQIEGGRRRSSAERWAALLDDGPPPCCRRSRLTRCREERATHHHNPSPLHFLFAGICYVTTLAARLSVRQNTDKRCSAAAPQASNGREATLHSTWLATVARHQIGLATQWSCTAPLLAAVPFKTTVRHSELERSDAPGPVLCEL